MPNDPEYKKRLVHPTPGLVSVQSPIARSAEPTAEPTEVSNWTDPHSVEDRAARIAELQRQMISDAQELAQLVEKEAFRFRAEDHHGVTTKITVELLDS